MGREEIQSELREEETKKVNFKIEKLNSELDREKSVLDLLEYPAFSKFFMNYVVEPLKAAQIASDNELDTNRSFRLKGDIRRLKTLLHWEATQKEKCAKLRDEREHLLRSISGEKDEHEPE